MLIDVVKTAASELFLGCSIISRDGAVFLDHGLHAE